MAKAPTSRKPCTGICHLCCSGRPHLDYEDVSFVFIVRNECCLFPIIVLLNPLFKRRYVKGLYPCQSLTQHKVWEPSFLPHHAHWSSLGGGGRFHYSVDAWQGQESGLPQDWFVPHGELGDWKTVCSLKPIDSAISLRGEFSWEKAAVIVQLFHWVLQRLLARSKYPRLPKNFTSFDFAWGFVQLCLGV